MAPKGSRSMVVKFDTEVHGVKVAHHAQRQAFTYKRRGHAPLSRLAKKKKKWMVKEKDQVSAAINMVSKKHDKDEATISRMQTRSMTSVMP